MSATRLRTHPRHAALLRLTIILFLVLSLVAVPPPAPVSADVNPAPVQLFYVTLPEADALTVLDSVNTAAEQPIWTYFSIAIGVDGAYVYYDQWEDGYAADIANPTGSEIYSGVNIDGVQIWGNGVAADGCAPNITGVPVTCTDGNDVLNAGDVIIPYNSIPLPRVIAPQLSVLDQFGAVAYNNNDGITTWNGDWVETGDFTTANYRDEFTTQAYNRVGEGTIDWSTLPWTEENDDGSAAAGTILINTTSDHLRFRESSVANDAIRRTANTSGYSAATLSFTLGQAQIDATGDEIRLQISSDGGANYTTLADYTTSAAAGAKSYDISAYIAANTTIRFIMVGDLETGTGDGEYWTIDNVDITVQSTGTSPSSGDILITSNALRFTATEPGDSIDRGVILPLGDACATLSFTLGQSSIDADEDRLAVQMSNNGGATYTTIDTYTSSAAAGAKSYGVNAYASSTSRVRFTSVDQLETGEYWTVDNVQITWDCRLPIRFDGRDKVGASSSIAMARAVWATGSGTLNAFAHEMYATAEWGLAYEAPVGTDTLNAGTMFEYSALSIMASQNNTTVQVDADANGSYETNVVLQEGGATLVPAIVEGAKVLADKPVQVLLATGDVGSNYASRDMNLLPVTAYGPSYWSPVGVINTASYPTRLFLYNLSTNGSIYITCEKYDSANPGTPIVTTLGPVLAGETVTTDLVSGQGAHCFASTQGGAATTDPIFAIGTVDSTNTAYDWSFTLFPDSFLSTDALVGLGLGRDPTSGSSPTQDGSPLWVTAACASGSTWVYVDWDNDGLADLVDTTGDGAAEAGSDSGISVNRLQSLRLFKPSPRNDPYDQSGARVWSRTASGVGLGGTAGCKLALAWGEDPATASAAAPGLDVGTSVAPLRLVESTKSLVIANDTAPLGVLNPGDTVYYNITIKNAGSFQVDNVHIYDTVPANTTYVADTTRWNLNNGGWTPIGQPDLGVLPIDTPGGYHLGDLLPGDTFYIQFQVTLNAGDYEDITNCETAYTDAGSLTRCTTTPVATKDWGDLPDTYGTSAAANGPRHSQSGLKLGALWDYEAGGIPTAGATGDDTSNLDDEDGVSLTGTQADWYNGNGSFNITVNGGPGCVNAWMDFTNDAGSGAGPSYADGNFTKISGYDIYTARSEHIINNVKLNNGLSSVGVLVPTGLNAFVQTQYYFRFRISPTDGQGECTVPIAPTGAITGGEVEDYQFALSDNPTAVSVFSFAASAMPRSVNLTWQTASSIDLLGFNVYRSTKIDGPMTKANAALITGLLPPGSASGAVFSYQDTDVKIGSLYYYWLEDVSISGKTNLTGPVQSSLVIKSDVPASPVVVPPVVAPPIEVSPGQGS